MANDDDLVVNSDGGGTAQLKSRIIREINASMSEKVSEQLAEATPPSDWEIWAVGPYQTLASEPSRIIELGESAYIVTIVFLNNFMFNNVKDFGGRIRLDFHTSNTQTMEPVPAMDDYCCFEPCEREPDIVLFFGVLYIIVREITPTEAACVLETNICARVCNCKDEAVPGYAAFVRWVYDVDVDLFFPPQGFVFDHPIRYLVYDNDDHTNCDCTEEC